MEEQKPLKNSINKLLLQFFIKFRHLYQFRSIGTNYSFIPFTNKYNFNLFKMSKSSSFFDWELSFRKNQPSKERVKRNREKISSIGIPINNFKKFLQECKEKNLN